MTVKSKRLTFKATQYPQQCVDAAKENQTSPDRQHATERFTFAESMMIQAQMLRLNNGNTPLTHAYSKLRMAHRSRAELDWLLWAYFVDSPYKVVCKPNESHTEYGLYVEFEIQPDFLLWGNKLAEFAQHLLSALDQLIYSMNTKCAGGQFNVGDWNGRGKFPIAIYRDLANKADRPGNHYFGGTGQPPSEVAHTDAKVRQIIERIQPFNTHPNEPEKNPFEIIRKLSNIDKHREPLPITLRPQFDYFFQTGNAGCAQSEGIEWIGRDFRGQPDGKIGHFTTPSEIEIQVEEGISLQPCIESVMHSAVDTFSHASAEIVGSEMSLPQNLELAVSELLQSIGDEMGWDEQLVSSGIPVDSREDVGVRRWLPGVGPCKPFTPVTMMGKSKRNW